MATKDSSPAQVALKVNRSIVYVSGDTIKYFKSDGNYTTIYLNDNSTLVSRISLKDLEEHLPLGQFIRIHKSFIVNRNFITRRKATKLYINETPLTIGRMYQKQVNAFLA